MIEIEYSGGTGIHARYIISKDGAQVATMSRHSVRSGWEIFTAYYDVCLGGARDIESAKAKALTLEYPTKQAAYETVCARVEKQRRAYKEKLHAHDLARIARAIVTGSNSAHVELHSLMTEIDHWIFNLADTRRREAIEFQRHFKATGECRYSYDIPFYPDPPELIGRTDEEIEAEGQATA